MFCNYVVPSHEFIKTMIMLWFVAVFMVVSSLAQITNAQSTTFDTVYAVSAVDAAYLRYYMVLNVSIVV